MPCRVSLLAAALSVGPVTALPRGMTGGGGVTAAGSRAWRPIVELTGSAGPFASGTAAGAGVSLLGSNRYGRQSLGYRRPRSSRRPGPTPRRAHRGRRPGSTLGRPRPRRSHTTLGSGLPTPTRSHYPGCRLTRHPYPAGPPARVRAQQLQHRPARRSWSCSRSSPSLDEPTAWFGPASVSDRHHPWNE